MFPHRTPGKRYTKTGESEVHMQVIERCRKITCSGKVITEYEAGTLFIRLIGTYGNRATLDDLLYSIACQKITERLEQKRDNIVPISGYGII